VRLSRFLAGKAYVDAPNPAQPAGTVRGIQTPPHVSRAQHALNNVSSSRNSMHAAFADNLNQAFFYAGRFCGQGYGITRSCSQRCCCRRCCDAAADQDEETVNPRRSTEQRHVDALARDCDDADGFSDSVGELVETENVVDSD